MDIEDSSPRRAGDPLQQLIRQELDSLSVDELQARIATLEAEIVRTRGRIAQSTSHRASAEALFRK